MSSILLSNPFVTAAPPPQTSNADAQTALAVAPVLGGAASSGARDATSYSGQGSGYGGGSGQQAVVDLMRGGALGAPAKPTDATPASVINAQAQDPEALFGANLPEVEMPDILPTAPWFKSDD